MIAENRGFCLAIEMVKAACAVQEAMARKQKEEGGRQPSTTKLNNMIMQMRKNCNHPDLISSAFTNEVFYPSAAELVAQCGKLQLLDRLLKKLKAKGHKCLIFSQVLLYQYQYRLTSCSRMAQ